MIHDQASHWREYQGEHLNHTKYFTEVRRHGSVEREKIKCVSGEKNIIFKEKRNELNNFTRMIDGRSRKKFTLDPCNNESTKEQE